MSRRIGVGTMIAVVLSLALLAACSPPGPTNGAFQPVDPQTGVQEGGTSNPN
jgi:hypothetical protein